MAAAKEKQMSALHASVGGAVVMSERAKRASADRLYGHALEQRKRKEAAEAAQLREQLRQAQVATSG